jgi:hypothetical protein
MRITAVFDQRKTKTCIHLNHSALSKQRREYNCVCSGGIVSGSTTIEEADFSNFDLMYLSFVSFPHYIPCDEKDIQEGRVQ